MHQFESKETKLCNYEFINIAQEGVVFSKRGWVREGDVQTLKLSAIFALEHSFECSGRVPTKLTCRKCFFANKN